MPTQAVLPCSHHSWVSPWGGRRTCTQDAGVRSLAQPPAGPHAAQTDRRPAWDPSRSPELAPGTSASGMTSGCRLRPPGFKRGCRVPPAPPPGPRPHTHTPAWPAELHGGLRDRWIRSAKQGSPTDKTSQPQGVPEAPRGSSNCFGPSRRRNETRSPPGHAGFFPPLSTQAHTCIRHTSYRFPKATRKGATLDRFVPCRVCTLRTSERRAALLRKRGGPRTAAGPRPVPGTHFSPDPQVLKELQCCSLGSCPPLERPWEPAAVSFLMLPCPRPFLPLQQALPSESPRTHSTEPGDGAPPGRCCL